MIPEMRQYQKKITFGKGVPRTLEGNDGDITIRNLRNKFKLYIKYNNRWHGVSVGEAFEKIEN